MVSIGCGSCFPTVVILLNNAVDDPRLQPVANGLAQAAVSLSRAAGPATAAHLFTKTAARPGDDRSLVGLATGRAFVFLVLAGLTAASIFASLAIPARVDSRERPSLRAVAAAKALRGSSRRAGLV